MLLRRAVVSIGVLLVLLLPPSFAEAGTIDVYSCRLADGTAAPASGWTPFSNFAYAGGSGPVSGDCGTQFGLMRADAPTQPGHEAGWRFDAPADTTIMAVALQRWASGYTNGTTPKLAYDTAFDQWPPSPAGDPDGETCRAGGGHTVCEFGDDHVMTKVPIPDFLRTGLRHTRLFLGMRCVIAQPCTAPDEAFWPGPGLTIYSARITLEDVAAPRFDRGPRLAGDGRQVAVAVADPGLGLAHIELLVDGNRASLTDLGAGATSCRPPYVDVVPCPSSRELDFALDPSGLTDGAHEIRVRAGDVVGNAATSNPLTITTLAGGIVAEAPETLVATPPPAAKAPLLAAWFEGRTRALETTIGYRGRGAVDGTLTDAAGGPIAHATLRVTDGSIAATAGTDAKGRFTYRPAAGPSRTIEFAYGAVRARVTLRVRAGVTLATSTKRVRNGTKLQFTGKVLGPRTRRALVTIYALGDGPHKRSTVATVRARSNGSFSYAYTFKSLVKRTMFRFEARVVKQTGLPYEEGASPRVLVRGRP
jgi:hypothetical protein